MKVFKKAFRSRGVRFIAAQAAFILLYMWIVKPAVELSRGYPAVGGEIIFAAIPTLAAVTGWILNYDREGEHYEGTGHYTARCVEIREQREYKSHGGTGYGDQEPESVAEAAGGR